MAEQDQDRSLAGRIGRHLGERAKAILPEVFETITDKIIPQGAAEAAQALNTGHGYVPYGSAQAPLEPEKEQATVHGKSPDQNGAAQPPLEPEKEQATVHGKSADQSYEQFLAQFQSRGRDQD